LQLDRKKSQQTFTTKANKSSCWTIKANKFHHTADASTTQKASKVDTKRIEFKGLITTNKGAPKQTKADHIAGKFW